MIYCEKDVFEKVGGFDEKLYCMEDSDLFGKLRKARAKFRVLAQPRIVFSTRRHRQEGWLRYVVKMGRIISSKRAGSQDNYGWGKF